MDHRMISRRTTGRSRSWSLGPCLIVQRRPSSTARRNVPSVTVVVDGQVTESLHRLVLVDDPRA